MNKKGIEKTFLIVNISLVVIILGAALYVFLKPTTEGAAFTLPIEPEEIIEPEVVETEEVVENNEIDDTSKILALVKEMDIGEGADIQDVISKSGNKETESILKNLLQEGEIFEIKPGKLKVLE